MKSLKDKILAELIKQPNQSARELAKTLNAEKKTVNKVLYSDLADQVQDDKSFRWSIVEQKEPESSISELSDETKKEVSIVPTENINFAFDSLQAIRDRLLDLTGRNRLLNFKHSSKGSVRVIDEMPDQLAENILNSADFNFLPVPDPKRNELIEHGYIEIDEEGTEVKLKPNPTAKEWANVLGFNTKYELPLSEASEDDKHNDTNIQTLLYPRELEAQLRNIRSKANTAIEETGANILYLAFGFLEWFEDENSDVTRQAPLYLIPVKVDKAKFNKELETYAYTITYTGEDIISNLSLREKLKHDFQLELPELVDEQLPEDYFNQIQRLIDNHKNKWRLKRFATLSMFDFGKLLMYRDLDPSRWPDGEKNIQNHPLLMKFFAKEGEDEGGNGNAFAEEYLIDELDDVHALYPLIDDADSSQHSALVDAIKGKNLVIEGPPGSGKSQTITNLIAAAISQGKKVLFVAEKMAALEVVKNRLTKAGLGDFCLELHSHKTQKKQVYESIKQRISKQGDFRYPELIDIEIKMYDERKKQLTEYAELINSEWKKTSKTIHKIFSAATRFREEFTSIDLSEIRPIGIDGNSYDQLSEIRILDELRKYSDVFEELRKQLGGNAQLSSHPWCGVYNKSIQMFENDEVCQLLKNWDDELTSLIGAVANVNETFGENNIKSTKDVIALLESAPSIPSLRSNEALSSLPLLTKKTIKEIELCLKSYRFNYKLFQNLSRKVESDLLSPGEKFDKLLLSVDELQDLAKDKTIKLSELYQSHQSIIDIQALIKSIFDDLSLVQKQDESLVNSIPTSIDGLNLLKEYLEHLSKLPLPLLSRRHEIFDNDELDQILPDLLDCIPKMQSSHQVLNRHFNIEELPSSAEIEELKNVLENAGNFRWFSGDWRNAKGNLFSITKSVKPKLSALMPLLPDLLEYSLLSEKLAANTSIELCLKHEFKGVHTSIDEVVQMRTWYKNIRKAYGIGFGTKVGLATSLLTSNSEVLKGIRHFAESKILNEIDQAIALCLKLRKVIKHDLIENTAIDIHDTTCFEPLLARLSSQTQVAQSSCKEDIQLDNLKSLLGEAVAFFNAETALKNTNKLVQNTFGDTYALCFRSEHSQNVGAIEATIELRTKLDAIPFEPLKNYLINNIGQDSLQNLKVIIDKVSFAYSASVELFKSFQARVALDDKVWLATTDGILQNISERNKKALTHPQWLSTWIDFVRVREVLTGEGLDNLLKQIERGDVALESIENIYKCAVFDVLAREILLEKEELAYFSGADQNAVRKQFQIYDHKLKCLQQEKIAHQVAAIGTQNTLSGKSSGKVSTYTEMGLINHQTSLKTRHRPIRQLIKSAGTSLASLKPCFMMGPHSVAQYLEPGQFEFDLIVMDEASQIKPEDALGTIARGKQLVVVGDPKQLPPTSFFDKTIEVGDEDVTAIEQSESILDVSIPMFNLRRLRWHYRSRHESLIAFSNQNFYDNNLVIFPSPASRSDEFGIKFTHVKTGRFVNQQNVEEAKVIAKAVRNHILNRKNESIGVVAMSSKQREQIERCVEELSKEDPMFRDALAENAHADEPLFLKNLENVQGDERDVIFISCTYGPQEAGNAHMPQRFGPINSPSGGRRLNVLFTRSKKRMHLFSSMTEGHILESENTNIGVKALKAFIAYARTGNLYQPEYTGKEPDSDFEISVMNALKPHGFECVPQVGASGYFIDLAVKDPGQPGRFLMGIECDGATYHSAKSARDRDRLRQGVLEGLGWNIRRIWSTDWFKNPQAQLNPIIEELNKLKTPINVNIQKQVESEVEQIEDVVEEETNIIDEVHDAVDENSPLEQKLQQFAQYIAKNEDEPVPQSKRLLRPAMVAALCEFLPVTTSEFFELIPTYLRIGTSKVHGKYLDNVLNIIAENELEV